MAAVSAISIGVLAGCTGSGSPTGSSATTATANGNRATAPAATVTMTAPPRTIAFVPITEPFDPGHPARPRQEGDDCPSQLVTLATAQCYHDMAEAQDAATDATLQAKFAKATLARQAAMNAADQAWLAARATVCAKAYHTGGTTDQASIARCVADESLARTFAVQGIQAPTVVLKLNFPEHQNPVDTSWFSAPDGSRIGLAGTQGDTAGSVIITWTVIAGANGFVVNPLQYYYRNGYFKDAGIMEQPDQAGHVVAPGTEYAFSIDYRNLAHDPYRYQDPGQFIYAPAGELAVWW
jgi:uncharacterized protein YecT (DUF1311 family)